jgi:hypothetical protein
MPGALTDVTAFYPPDQVEVLDASTGQWVAVTDPTQYYNLFTGEWGAPSWISISNAYNGIRFTWTSFPYRWIKAIWMYIMPKDNTFNIKLEVSSDGVTWTEVLYDTNMRGWPSHYLHVFDSYVSTNGKPYLRLTIEFNWTGAQTTVAIGGIRVFASYDWITRANYLPFTADYSRNITFYGNVSPNSDNTQDLGSTTLRWSNIHSWNAHFNVLTIRDSSWTTRFQLDLDTTNSRIVFRSPYSYQFQFAEDIVPGNDNAFDLGSSTYRWRNLYLAGNASTDKNKYFRVGLTMLHQQSADEGGIYFNVYNDGTGWKVLDTTKRGYLVQLGLDSIDFWFTQTVGGTDWALKFRVMYNGTWYTYGTGYVQTMLPKLDATYDLGSSTYRWRNAYLSGSAVLGDGTLKLSQDTTNYSLRIDTAYGYVKIGPVNTLWIHFLSDGKPFYFSTKIGVNGNVEPYNDNTYDLGSSTLRWRNLFLSNSLYFTGNAEYLYRGIYAYKIKHGEGTHPGEVDDFLYRFVFKYLDNMQTSTIINNLSHSFSDDYYTGIYAVMIYIANDGYYDFGVNSDDASAVFVDGILAAAWLGGHGVAGNWYETSFNSVCNGVCDVDGDGTNEPCHRTTLHPNGIYLSKGWHLVVAVFEEVGGADKIEVYIRPHQNEDPSVAGGTSTGWALIGDGAVSAGYILDYRAVPIGMALWVLNQVWKSTLISNPERNRIDVYASLRMHGNIDAGGSVVPISDNTYDLGSSTLRWRDVWSSGRIVSDGYIAAQGGYSITANPPTIPTNRLGWKIGLWGSGYWLGIANWTFAVRTDAWLSIFKGVNPANDASGSVPDSNAGISLGGSTGKEVWFGRDFRLYSGGAGLLKLNAGIQPDADNTYDLGTPSNRWRDLYVARDAVIEKLWSVPEMILAEDDEGLTAFVSTSGGTSYVVAFFDNTVVYVNGKFQGVLNAGQRLQLTLNAGDVVTANKPIMLHSSSERHVPMTWKDTKFVIPFYRNDPQTIYIYAPDADATVDIYVGTSTTPTTTVTVTKGTATKVQINVTPPNTVILESTAPILVAVSSNNETYDFRFVPPPATDLILIPSNIFYVSALEDNTTITWFQGNNSGTYTLNRGEIVSSTTLGITTGTQYNAIPVRVIADKPIMIASFADGDGTDATNGLPVNKLGTLYVLPVAAQWLAIAVPFDNTRIKIYYQGQLKYETTVSNTYTYNTPALLYLTPSTIDSTWTSIPYGTMIESDKPIMVIFDCAEVWTDDETILLGINHRKWRIYYNEALTLTTDIVPPQDATYDLGSSSYYWRDLYLKGSIHNLNTMWMSATTGDKISLYDNRLGATNMYGFGVEASTLYYKSWAYHRWYINANADGGASAVMQLSSSDLKLRVPILPWSDNTYDLGSSTLRWRNFYAVNAYVTTLSVGDLLLTGHGARWRLVEREDGIYLLNEKTGKWYRVVLEEVGGVGA